MGLEAGLFFSKKQLGVWPNEILVVNRVKDALCEFLTVKDTKAEDIIKMLFLL